jgi:cytidylate kinase
MQFEVTGLKTDAVQLRDFMAIITISRGSYSGGKAVAEQLAARLDCPVISREQVLLQAAEDYGISERELTDSLNHPPPFWQQVLGKRMAYVKCVTAVLFDHVRQGSLVYHGNVGHLLLSGVPPVLRVRVIAGMEQRIEAAMAQAKLNREQAIAHIQRVDNERSKWARVLYGVNWNDPGQYDVILNLERISVGSACEMIARMAELPEFQLTDASRKQLEDASLSSKVWAAMAKNPLTRSASLEVTAKDGEVTITGNVSSTKAAEAVSDIAGGVSGVKLLRSEVGMGADWHW